MSALPTMMGRVPLWLVVLSTVLLAVPKQLWSVPKLLSEVRRWLGVLPKVLLRAVLVVEGSARTAADSDQFFESPAC